MYKHSLSLKEPTDFALFHNRIGLYTEPQSWTWYVDIPLPPTETSGQSMRAILASWGEENDHYTQFFYTERMIPHHAQMWLIHKFQNLSWTNYEFNLEIPQEKEEEECLI